MSYFCNPIQFTRKSQCSFMEAEPFQSLWSSLNTSKTHGHTTLCCQKTTIRKPWLAFGLNLEKIRYFYFISITVHNFFSVIFSNSWCAFDFLDRLYHWSVSPTSQRWTRKSKCMEKSTRNYISNRRARSRREEILWRQQHWNGGHSIWMPKPLVGRLGGNCWDEINWTQQISSVACVDTKLQTSSCHQRKPSGLWETVDTSSMAQAAISYRTVE